MNHLADVLDVFVAGLDDDVRSELCLINAAGLKDASDLLQQRYWALAHLLDLQL